MVRRPHDSRAVHRSPQQRLLFFLEAARPRGSSRAMYGLQSAFRLTGPVSIDRLRLAWGAVVVEAQQTLACDLQLLGGEFMMESCRSVRDLDERRRTWEWVSVEPEHGPLMQLVYLSSSSLGCLLLRAHCAVCDGTGLGVLAERLEYHYRNLATAGPTGPAELHHSSAMEENADFSDDGCAYWSEVLTRRTLPSMGICGLATSFGRSPRTAELRYALTPGVASKLGAMSEKGRLSLFSIGLAAWAIFLYRKFSDAFLIPTLTLARRTGEREHAFGGYLDLLLIPSPPPAATDFKALAHAMQEATIDTLEHECAFMTLVERHPLLRQSLRDPEIALIPFQALRSAPARSFLLGETLAEGVADVVTCNAGYSLPFDGLITLLDAGDRFELIFEYQLDRFIDRAAYELLHEFQASFESDCLSVS